jgi:hypothetical protein
VRRDDANSSTGTSLGESRIDHEHGDAENDRLPDAERLRLGQRGRYPSNEVVIAARRRNCAPPTTFSPGPINSTWVPGFDQAFRKLLHRDRDAIDPR